MGSLGIDSVSREIEVVVAAIAAGFSVRIQHDAESEDHMLTFDSGYGRGGGFWWSGNLSEALDLLADHARSFGTDLADDLWTAEHRNYQTPTIED